MVRSLNGQWKEGDVALAYTGWQRYVVLGETEVARLRRLDLLVQNKVRGEKMCE